MTGATAAPGASELAALVEQVREASREGRLAPIDEVWRGGPETLIAALGPGQEDIGVVRAGGGCYVYSEQGMTRRFAEAEARARASDPARTIAETVRDESAVYPRPTAVEAFTAPPFRVEPSRLEEAVARLASEAEFADIREVRASDGSRFLYSIRGLDPDRAQSMAEWIAVGRDRNP